MTRSWLFAVTAASLGAVAFAQPRAPSQPPNSITLCPITHNCRPSGTRPKPAVPPTMPAAGAIHCPPGTYQIQATNKCRVK